MNLKMRRFKYFNNIFFKRTIYTIVNRTDYKDYILHVTTPSCKIIVCDSMPHVSTLIPNYGIDIGILASARISTNSKAMTDPNRDKKLVKFLIDNKHFSTLTPSFTLDITAPIFVARHVMRHLYNSTFNEMSGRYTEFEEIYCPEFKRVQHKKNKQMSVTTTKRAFLLNFASQLNLFLYKLCLANGYSKEDARMIMPLSTLTKFRWTANLRTLYHFITLRLDKSSQTETRELAKAVQLILQNYCPMSFEAFSKTFDEEQYHV